MAALPLLDRDGLVAEIDDSHRRINRLLDQGSVSPDAHVRQLEAVATQQRWIDRMTAQVAQMDVGVGA